MRWTFQNFECVAKTDVNEINCGENWKRMLNCCDWKVQTYSKRQSYSPSQAPNLPVEHTISLKDYIEFWWHLPPIHLPHLCLKEVD